jgi:ATP-binding cassette, subfamily F, member 3
MLAVSNLSKSYGLKSVLQNVSFTIKIQERLGLVGPNGCGKTTLIHLITGIEKQDAGSIHLTPSDTRIGYLAQGFTFDAGETIASFLDKYRGNLDTLSEKLGNLADGLVKDSNHLETQQEYDEILARITILSQTPDPTGEMLAAFGLDKFPLDTPASYLSGGQKTRLALAGILISYPQLLLLDEPTNHLDIEMLEWLENWLVSYPFSALIVSHDRAFLDNTVTGILELDPATQKTREYVGNYSDYQDQKQAEHQRNWQEYTDQQGEISRLSEAAAHMRGIAQFRKGGKADSGDKFARGFFANRSLGTVGRAKNLEQRLNHLLTDDHIEKPRKPWQMRIEFNNIPSSGRDVLVMEHLAIGYNGIPLLQNIDLTLRYNQRAALIGQNGAGKTTLLRTILGLLPPIEGICRTGSNVQVGYMAQEQENLKPDANALTTILEIKGNTETEARSYLSKYLFTGDSVFTPVGNMSYGERSRLSLACLVAKGCNFLLLDEPINHLDIPSRVRFEEALSEFEGTILAVIHDRYFIQTFATTIWEVENKTIRIIA